MKKNNFYIGNWSLIFTENERLVSDGKSSDIDVLRKRGYTEISASVPGNPLRDMANVGMISEPYFGANSAMRTGEYTHFFYVSEFFFDGSLSSPFLVFEGIDTVADIYLNGVHIGRCENMFTSHEFDISEIVIKGNNRLLVHITPAVIEARKYQLTMNDSAQKYNYPSLYIRKAAHSFGWDIFPRFPAGGLFRPVFIKETRKERIKEIYAYTTKLDGGRAELNLLYNLDIASDDISRYSLCINGKCGKSVFCKEEVLWHTGGKMRLTVDDAVLWYPRGSGEPNLYDVSVSLIKDKRELDTYTLKLGIRTVELQRTSITDGDGNGEFCFMVNGKKIFCKGTNFVPCDALHANDEERLGRILPMLTDLECNMIRVWGGGIYESDTLYEFCDENGIMVWQDFMMGCAVYPSDDRFAEKIRTEAEFVVKRLRQHPSIVLWAGDNENDIAYLGWYDKRRDPNENRLTRDIIPAVLLTHDFTRPYLPSSPYVDSIAFESEYKYMPEDHLWGPRDYFKGEYYSTSLCHFVSETGYHGCPSPKSLRRFISEEKLFSARDNKTWQCIENNDEWLIHSSSPEADLGAPYSYRIRLMADQVVTLFGESVPFTLEDFAKASQISQAEAKKFFIERCRTAKWRKTGILWWNLIDGWPQISDAVVDYYFTKKLAYSYIKRSQAPVCIIAAEPDAGGEIPVFAVNDLNKETIISYKIKDIKGEMIFEGEYNAPPDSSEMILKIPDKNSGRRIVLIEWVVDGKAYSNHYIEDIRGISYSEYLGFMSITGYSDYFDF